MTGVKFEARAEGWRRGMDARPKGGMEKGLTAGLGWLRLFVVFVVVSGVPKMIEAEAGGDAECCDEKGR